MASPSSGEITKLLLQVKSGSSAAENELLALVYAQLHSLAERQMSKERSDHTLQPTALVNEVYLRLMGKAALAVQDRTHFFATAATVMRHILVDYAKKRSAAKNGGIGQVKVQLEDFLASSAPRVEEWLILDDALTQLAAMDERQARLVELVFFGGLTLEEAGADLGISERQAKRDWKSARAWLQAVLRRKSPR